jgi:anti-anti-sigma factor
MQNPTVVPVEGTDIVRIVIGADRLDVYNALALRALSVHLVSELRDRQILDLEGVRDADSTSLGVIVGAGKRALNHGGCLLLANVGPSLAHTLRITGLDKTLIIASDIDSAVAFFQPPQLEYEDDPEPPAPRAGDSATCACGALIYFINCSHGGWWDHDAQLGDNHEAELGGPA